MIGIRGKTGSPHSVDFFDVQTQAPMDIGVSGVDIRIRPDEFVTATLVLVPFRLDMECHPKWVTLDPAEKDGGLKEATSIHWADGTITILGPNGPVRIGKGE